MLPAVLAIALVVILFLFLILIFPVRFLASFVEHIINAAYNLVVSAFGILRGLTSRLGGLLRDRWNLVHDSLLEGETPATGRHADREPAFPDAPDPASAQTAEDQLESGGRTEAEPEEQPKRETEISPAENVGDNEIRFNPLAA